MCYARYSFVNSKEVGVRALLSVSDKQGLDTLASGLQRLGVTIYSTGNTARALDAAGVPVAAVHDLTHFPEILDGRVKTLHPAIHAGILACRAVPAHMETLREQQIAPIDLVVVNLYPFRETIARAGVTLDEAIEQIDVGGPAMIRAAAKNHADVLVVVDPADYPRLLEALKANSVDAAFRRELAAKAFAHTAAYDAAIAAYLNQTPFPTTLPVAYPLAQTLRYGENPHQSGALYGAFDSFFTHLHGKELSYINILDIAAAQELIEEFAEMPTVAILKHTNPCGVGSGATLEEAWNHAFATDREAPFGGVIVANRPVDAAFAAAIDEIFSEIVIAPDFAPEALKQLQKKKQRRLIKSLKAVAQERALLFHSVPGGVLVQEADRATLDSEEWRVVTERQPTEQEAAALRFGWRVVKHVKSNAIVYAAADRTLGVGAGQMSRVDSSRIASLKAARAELSLAGAALASDAFFPFPDGVEVAAQAGATAVIQPGGSMRDQDVIDAANCLGLTMVFTGRRHFRH